MLEWPDMPDRNQAVLLSELLGYKWVEHCTEQHKSIFTMLASPHGYAIYKTLLARKESKTPEGEI